MKLFALFLLLPAMARCVTVETLPQSEFADKEVFDCGRWFRRSAADDYETVETDNQGQTLIVTSGRAERNFRLRKSRLDEEWNLVKVTRRGVSEIGEVAVVEGRKPGFAVEVR